MKQVLDSLQGMQSKIDEIQGALVETTSAVAAGQHRAEELTARLAAIESSPRTALKHVTVPPLDAGVGTSAEANPLGSPLTSPSGAAAARPPAQVSGSGSADRRDPTLYRGDAPGILGIQRSTPVTGTQPSPHAKSPEHHYEHEIGYGTDRRGSTPKMDFPRFEGENPMVWQQDCETYFELYHVSDALRTRYASLNFRGTAALWLRNVQARRKIDDWGEMCRMVHDKFGKNRYMHYRRQMRALRQVGTVSEYIEKFEILKNQLLLYNPALDESFFVDEFLNGLQDDLRSAIHLHCPPDLDTASLLALMQEEDMATSKKHSTSGTDNRDTTKFSSRYGHSQEKFSSKEKQTQRSDDSKKPEHSKWEERLDTLRAYRRSKGQCFTCGEKYTRTHKCPDKIPLHVIEELMELLPIHADNIDDASDGDSDTDDLMLIAATDTPNVAKKKNTIRLQGTVGKHQMLILIDSGSVASFISTDLAKRLQCSTQNMTARQFTVADGHPVQCTEFVPDFE
jgi:hypothetical protein